MGRIPDETIQQLRDRIDIVGLVGRFVTLKKAGRSYKGLCPFHDEKTPSFSVSPDRQSFHCFGCQEGGNAFSFLMKLENLTFPEAVRALAREHGLEIPEDEPGERGLIERLREVLELAQARYRAALQTPGNPAGPYLIGRGLDAPDIERFGIGFAPDGWDFLVSALRAARIPAELGERAGLLAPRESGGHYDRLRGRVVFPIQDVRGQVIAFAGRALAAGQEPKYLNTPETPLFRKRAALFGFPRALEPIRRLDRAVVVEGYFDAVAAERAGVEGCVATCGTALTPEHARELRRRTGHVVLLFDGDEPGQAAMERALEVLLPAGVRVRAAVLPGGQDPDDFLAREGPEALRRLVDEAPPALAVSIRRAVARGCRTPWEKADAVGAVAPLLARLPGAVERSEFCAQLALAVGTDPRHVEAAVRAAERGEAASRAMPEQDTPSSADRPLRQLALCLVQHPVLAGRVCAEEFQTLAPPGPLRDVVSRLLAADAGTDVEELGRGLDAPALSALRALVADELGVDEEAARRTVEDTLAWLRERQRRERQRALTHRLKEPGVDARALLREKDDLTRRGSVARRGRSPIPMDSSP